MYLRPSSLLSLASAAARRFSLASLSLRDSMLLRRLLRPGIAGLARDLPFLPGFVTFERGIERLAQRLQGLRCHVSQITSISALLAIDFSVMCGTRS